MEGTNLAAVLHDKLDVRLETLLVPEPAENEVQVRPHHVGICGTDVHLWQSGVIGDLFSMPMILGHECSGVVSKVGPGVTQFKVGDRVAVEPLRPCRKCRLCSEGHYNVCPNSKVCYAQAPHNGALARYIVLHTSCVFKLPDNVSFEEGALMEPLSVALYACTRVGISVGDTVLICGSGTIGLCVLMIAKAHGASTIIVADINSSRLESAKKLGATHTFHIDPETTPEQTANQLKTSLGCAPDKAVECSAAESALSLCIHVLKPCGVLGLLGLADSPLTVPITDAVFKDLDIKAILSFVNTYPTVIDMVSRGKVDVKPLVTHRYSLQETLEALEMSKSGVGIKVMIKCNSD